MTSGFRPASVKVVVASTVMLSFISFWRAAAIVLSDLASSAFYVGGIAETAIGKAAPWFILSIMLFSFAVRAIYIESCSMFVRGGVYKVVHEALGGTLAKFSVSALMFDYVLTGPISGVSAGLYLGGLVNEMGELSHLEWMRVHPPHFAALFAGIVTMYFWRKNIIGLQESSEKAMRIMQVTSVMVVTLILWCIVTVLKNGYQPVPAPVVENFEFGHSALGWLTGTAAPTITAIAILVGLGHSILAMSGFETLAQVYRELASPKLKNLQRAGWVICIYSTVFTALVSFFAVMIIPDSARHHFADNLIGGLSMYLIGPVPLKLLFHGFVVLVGVLLLSGAVNTSIIGSNGVLNRVAEDGVLPEWFRKPDETFGTTSRIIGVIVGLQLVTIVVSAGNMRVLSEAYAFGVVWSFAMKALSILVLRYKHPGPRDWKVPLNFRIGETEIPLGLIAITVALLTLATINVLTKQVATISGISFTLVFFLIFEWSERQNRKRQNEKGRDQEKFLLAMPSHLDAKTVNVRPGNVLVAVRNPKRLYHLDRVLRETANDKLDIVVLTVRSEVKALEYQLKTEQIFAEAEAELFTRVVTLAEKAGKHVELLVVPGSDPYDAAVQIAARLESSRIVMGLSPKLTPSEQAAHVGMYWEKFPKPRPSLSLEIVPENQNDAIFFNLGPHPPRLWPQDIELAHRLWLELKEMGPGSKLHHRDVVGVALRRMSSDIQSGRASEVLADVQNEVAGGRQ